MIKQISLILMILMLVPMVVSADSSPYTGYVLINVYDGMTHDALEDVNIEIYTSAMEYICDVYSTDVDGSYLSKIRFYEDTELIFLIYHNDYYTKTMEFRTPYYTEQMVFEAHIGLFKRASNVNISIPESYESVVGMTDFAIKINVTETDVVFGGGTIYNSYSEKTSFGPALIVKTDAQMIMTPHEDAWYVGGYNYYLFNLYQIYNDVVNPTDGVLYYNLGMDLDVSVNISIILVEAYVTTDLEYRHASFMGPISLTYNSTSTILNYTQEYGLKLFDRFQTTYPLDYTIIDDLITITSTTSTTTTSIIPVKPHEYTTEEWLIVGGFAAAMFVIFFVMIWHTNKRKY